MKESLKKEFKAFITNKVTIASLVGVCIAILLGVGLCTSDKYNKFKEEYPEGYAVINNEEAVPYPSYMDDGYYNESQIREYVLERYIFNNITDYISDANVNKIIIRGYNPIDFDNGFYCMYNTSVSDESELINSENNIYLEIENIDNDTHIAKFYHGNDRIYYKVTEIKNRDKNYSIKTEQVEFKDIADIVNKISDTDIKYLDDRYFAQEIFDYRINHGFAEQINGVWYLVDEGEVTDEVFSIESVLKEMYFIDKEIIMEAYHED